MESISFAPLNLYSIIYHSVIVTLCFITVFYYFFPADDNIQNDKHNVTSFMTLLLAIVIIIVLGLRPEKSGGIFGDTGMYAHWYVNIIDKGFVLEEKGEWLWSLFALFLKENNFTVNEYFLAIEFLYVGLSVLAAFLLMRDNLWIACLFIFVSFSFYGFAVNGLRNGVACSILLCSIALISKGKIEKTIGIILMILAYFVHHSAALPAICAIVSMKVIDKPIYAIRFWMLSILISLLAGNAIGDFFVGLGFDDRLKYFQDVADSEYAALFSSTGFRFDFVAYSVFPIIFIWYLTVKRNFKDTTYNIIANTYILANAFWIMVIRSTCSNRFAYLSWFLYPIVIAYPLLRMSIWDDQDHKTALILLAYSGFTFFMQFVYYA